jgi:hypothetical protein
MSTSLRAIIELQQAPLLVIGVLPTSTFEKILEYGVVRGSRLSEYTPSFKMCFEATAPELQRRLDRASMR